MPVLFLHAVCCVELQVWPPLEAALTGHEVQVVAALACLTALCSGCMILVVDQGFMSGSTMLSMSLANVSGTALPVLHCLVLAVPRDSPEH